MKPRLPAVIHSPAAACPAGCGQGAGVSGPCRCAFGGEASGFWGGRGLGGRAGGVSRAVCVIWHTTFRDLRVYVAYKEKELYPSPHLLVSATSEQFLPARATLELF
jgi:hypothetical protein